MELAYLGQGTHRHGRNYLGTRRTRPPTFSDGVDIICHVLPPVILKFFIWKGVKNESDVCRILCEELFMLDVTHSQFDVETEFGVVSLILMFFLILAFS